MLLICRYGRYSTPSNIVRFQYLGSVERDDVDYSSLLLGPCSFNIILANSTHTSSRSCGVMFLADCCCQKNPEHAVRPANKVSRITVYPRPEQTASSVFFSGPTPFSSPQFKHEDTRDKKRQASVNLWPQVWPTRMWQPNLESDGFGNWSPCQSLINHREQEPETHTKKVGTLSTTSN